MNRRQFVTSRAAQMRDRDSAIRWRSALSRIGVLLRILAAGMLASTAAEPALAQSADGEAIYRERCVGCHETGAARAPDLATLRQMSPDRVLGALRSGSMSTQAQGLSNAQLDNLSRFVAGAATVQNSTQSSGACTDAPASLGDALAQPHWNG
jgi:mono/diheme cytochrome c family protein